MAIVNGLDSAVGRRATMVGRFQPVSDGLIRYAVDLGYAESDSLFAIHALHQAVGDTLKILGSLEDGSRNELSADGNA